MSSPGRSAIARPVKIPAAIIALIGLILAAVSLLVFVFDLLVTPEIGALMVSFVVCGLGLTTGLMLLQRIAPRSEPMSLFGGSDGVPVPNTSQAEARAPLEQVSMNCSEAAIAMPPGMKADSISNSNRHQSISRYKARESSGALALATAIGLCLVLGGRVAGGWAFLSLVVPAGSAVALVLYWSHSRQATNISAYKIPVAGGIIGAAAVAGVGLVMLRFHFLRDFLLLAVGAGCAVALCLFWAHRRTENSGGSFL